MPPCDSITTSTISEELKNVDEEVLTKALEAMGLKVRATKTAGLNYSGYHKETGQYYTGAYKDGKLNQKVQQGSPKLDITQVKIGCAVQTLKKGSNAFTWKLSFTSKLKEIYQ